MEKLDWINAREMHIPKARSIKPPVDKIISEIVGHEVYTTDPRILKVVTKFKQMKKGNDDTPDNLSMNPHFIKELKEVFAQPI